MPKEAVIVGLLTISLVANVYLIIVYNEAKILRDFYRELSQKYVAKLHRMSDLIDNTKKMADKEWEDKP